jgi:chromate transporter
MKQQISLRELFWEFFKINSVTFGGGFVIMPIIKKAFVDKKHLLEEKDMLDMIALAQSLPGVMAVNTSMLVGHRLRGVKGSIISLLGGILPPLVIVMLISVFYTAFQTNPIILAALRGMRGAVSAVMVVAAYSMLKSVLKTDKIFSIILVVLSFIVAYFTDISIAYVMLSAGIIGYLYFTYIAKEKLS